MLVCLACDAMAVLEFEGISVNKAIEVLLSAGKGAWHLGQQAKDVPGKHVLRYLIFLWLPLMLLLTVRMVTQYQIERADFDSALQRSQQSVLRDMRNLIFNKLDPVVRDVRYLANVHGSFHAFLSNDKALQYLEENMATLMGSRPDLYDQIRYLDQQGNELIRIDNVQGTPTRISAQELQNKSDRYYFQKTLALPPLSVYMSPLDLNLENGKIEQPLKPMLRFGSRVFGRDGSPQGVMVINLLGAQITERMRRLTESYGAKLWLLNDQGHWLLGSDPQDEWGNMYPNRSDLTLGARYPDLWQHLSAQNASDIKSQLLEQGLVSTQLVNPGAQLVSQPFQLQTEPQSFWRMVVWLPAERRDHLLRPLQLEFAGNYAGLSVFFLVLSLLLAAVMHRFKLTVELLAQREEQIAAVLDGAPDAILVTNLQGKIVFANKKAEEFLGYPRHSLLGQSVDMLFALQETSTSGAVSDLGHTALAAWPKAGKDSILAVRSNREEVPVVLSLNQISTHDGQRIIGTLRDVSYENAAEKAILNINEALNASNKSLAFSNSELEKFAYSVSHDLRSPLRAIYGFGQILMTDHKSDLSEEALALLKRILASSQAMNALIDDMLALSRVSITPMARTELDLSALVRVIFDDLRSQEPERQVDVSIEPGLRVLADEGLVRIALTNLISNAWKFTAQKDHARIEFGAGEFNGQKMFFLKDNGTGFNMAYADKLFRAFHRLHAREAYAGTGIGLATVARVIERHGGSIQAKAEVGQGAEFRFLF